MEIIGECSQPNRTNMVVKVLFTVRALPQDEYVHLNLSAERIGEFKAGKRYRITIKEE